MTSTKTVSKKNTVHHKHNFSEKKKDKVKRKKKMMILKEKIENTAKGKCRFRREE